MVSLNKVLLIGNLTRDVEIVQIGKTTCADVGIAVNRVWHDDEGNKKEEPCYLDCRAFGKNADSIKKHFSKGRPIFIEGRLQYSTWEDKNTQKKMSKVRVIIEQWGFMDKKPSNGAELAGATDTTNEEVGDFDHV